MLREMGVTVWLPQPREGMATPAPAPGVAAESAAVTARAPAVPAVVERPAAPAAAPAGATPGLVLHEPVLLYANVDPAAAPADLGAGWLVVAEALPGAADGAFAGDAGRLLDNMLRALRLHRHPRVHLARIHREAAAGAGGAGSGIDAALQAQVAQLRPSMVLLMGRVAAQAALRSTEPLGRLRAQVHQVGGVPAVATFDAPYLLRNPADKGRAWADLCMALGSVR
ncbi:MAG: hypothetical protein GAK38_00035 [Xylophilus sp.]|nr:MAG: hypothetical protein GAK38_00035 [Xylophilus sp.]